MKLEKITINNKEYYQFKDLTTNEVGDLFTDWKEIPSQRQRLLNYRK